MASGLLGVGTGPRELDVGVLHSEKELWRITLVSLCMLRDRSLLPAKIYRFLVNCHLPDWCMLIISFVISNTGQGDMIHIWFCRVQGSPGIRECLHSPWPLAWLADWMASTFSNSSGISRDIFIAALGELWLVSWYYKMSRQLVSQSEFKPLVGSQATQKCIKKMVFFFTTFSKIKNYHRFDKVLYSCDLP